MIPLAQNPQPNFKKIVFILNKKIFILKFFLFETNLSQGLNSSLAQSAAELWLAKVCPERENYAFSEKFELG